jgi:hypothetical protein
MVAPNQGFLEWSVFKPKDDFWFDPAMQSPYNNPSPTPRKRMIEN